MIKHRSKIQEGSSQKGSDIEQPINISLEEAYTGTTRLMEIRSTIICPQCKGKKKLYFIKPCRTCQRQGEVPHTNSIDVTIPAGIYSGAKIRLAGLGNPARVGGLRGDLFLIINVEPDTAFERKGDDLSINIEVEEYQVQVGHTITLAAPDRQPLFLKLPPGTTNKSIVRMANQGMPRLNSRGKGDLLINVTVLPSSKPAQAAAPTQLTSLTVKGGTPSKVTIGNYHFQRLLGKGGFADVYLAEHVFLKTKVAIKVMRGAATPQQLQSFTAEAQTIAALKHPSIIRLLDFGQEEATPYLVMEYAPHGTLRDLHTEGSIVDVDVLLPYVQQIASALQYAHDRKLIHRDIKPENILLETNKAVLLSDFGIAVASHTTQSMTMQEAIGTVIYMAPEQIKGKPQPASDQYSLGVVVYELLCGEQPFDGQTSVEIAMKHLAEPPPSLRSKVPSIHPDIEQVVLKTLRKDPKQRFSSIEDFANTLTQVHEKLAKQLLKTDL